MMERSTLLRHDLDWLPPRYRAIRWGVAGVVWNGLLGGVGAIVAFSHFHFFYFGKGLAALAAGGYVAGDRAARRALRGSLRRLAHGAVDPARLPASPDGELVHVSGRVRVRPGADGHPGTVTGIVYPRPAVWRRLVYSLDGRIHAVHEAACDFWLVGDGGEAIVVDVGHARLLAPDASKVWINDTDHRQPLIEALPMPPPVMRARIQRQERRGRGKRVPRFQVAETLLRDGDLVEVLGYKSRTIDPSVADRLARDTPYRATLRGGQALPLLIAPRSA
jgi:hypothetical protein